MKPQLGTICHVLLSQYGVCVYGRLAIRLCLKVAALLGHPGDPPYLEDINRKHVKHPLKPRKTMEFEEASGNGTSAKDFRSLVVQL